MTTQQSLLDELDDAVAHGAADRRTEMLQRVTDLFVFSSQDYSDKQMALFDDVLLRLTATIEISARVALANRLATAPLVPSGISRTLASDDSIDVAGPILAQYERLDSGLLVDCANTKSQQHLLAISRRKFIDEVLTDALVARGSRPVVLSTAGNPGAKFSETGYTTLIRRSEDDDELAICVGSRRDLPRHQFVRLLTKASHTVRGRLEAIEPLISDAIQDAIAEAASSIQAKTRTLSRNYLAASAHVESLKAAGRLSEVDVEAFARANKFEETTVSLALLCDLPIEAVERAMVQDRPETVLIVAKAMGLSWPTVKGVLRMRAGERVVSAYALEQCLGTYSRLKPATARQVLEFYRKRAHHG